MVPAAQAQLTLRLGECRWCGYPGLAASAEWPPAVLRVRLSFRPVRLSVWLHDEPDAAVDEEVLAADLAGVVALTGHIVEVERVAVVGHLDPPVLPGRRAKQVRSDPVAREGPPLREERVPELCARPVALALRP